MTRFLQNIIPDEYINEILSLPEVLSAKARITSQSGHSVSFSIQLTHVIKSILRTQMDLDLTNIDSVPMRWIKGDTHPHIDVGSQSFTHTHLIYCTDSPGSLIVDGVSYPIQQGSGYIFEEGLSHETIGTGTEPRLLLGPFNETGQAVGVSTIIDADGQTDIIYFKYVSGSGITYRINSGIDNGVSLPIVIRNTNTSYTLKVLFETNITIESNICYFICDSDNIQFGSETLNENGLRPQFTIEANNYPGLIQNGNSLAPGFNDIYIYNLDVYVDGYTLDSGAGWICQTYFGKGASTNYVINCTSNGNLPGGGSGGIVGSYTGTSAGTVNIIGCSFTGTIGVADGGIVGSYAGSNGGLSGRVVTCLQCWSTGVIALNGGGIFGSYAGDSGAAQSVQCYSTGSVIDDYAGGIFAINAGNNSGQAIATKSYSQGTISFDAGGIFGANAGSSSGIARAENCYSSGVNLSVGDGLYGSGSTIVVPAANCYVAGGSWSDVAAAVALDGEPTPVVGTIWVATGTNQPYELNYMGYTPYSLTVINSDPLLVQTYSQSIQQGQSSIAAILADASGVSFIILKKAGGNAASYETITMAAGTGVIQTTAATVPGTYTLTVRSVGSYNITTFELTVTEATSGQSQTISCCERAMDLTGVDYTTRNHFIAGNTLIGSTSIRRQPITYMDLLNKKSAYAAKR